jgi:bifunctional enzyme CysN/CysC
MIGASTYKRDLVRISTAGSIDDGKSTLFGRLLLDTGSIYTDTLASIEKRSTKIGIENSLALVTDGLKAEREQGITIDVAYRYLTTSKRRFILADSPGHEQYTRNMATAASTSDLAIILIDATKGILPQTKRHAFISALMGVNRFLMAINKMDLVDFSEAAFEKIREDFSEFASRLGVHEIRFVPVSALHGDNVAIRSDRMKWYHGETVLEYLDNVYVAGDVNLVDFRFPVQMVLRGSGAYRGYAGQVLSGIINEGDEVVILPSRQATRVKKIESPNSNGSGRNSARARESIVLCLEDELDISRGEMIVRAQNTPPLKSHFEALLVWMSEEPLDFKAPYIIRHTTREAKVQLDALQYRVDVNTLSREKTSTLNLNDIGRVALTSSIPLALDTYKNNRLTGSFTLIHPQTFATVAAGTVIERAPETFEEKGKKGESKTPDLHHQASLVKPAERIKRSGVNPVTIWFSGLSGSGKSSIACGVERLLFDEGIPVFRLDGDNLRSGLNKDLGFSAQDRSENLRRAAEAAKLLNEAGVVVLSSFITPREEDRKTIEEILSPDKFIHVYISTPLEECERRDPHGLYKKAREGKIADFTGVSSAFDVPSGRVALTIDASTCSLEEAVLQVVSLLKDIL